MALEKLIALLELTKSLTVIRKRFRPQIYLGRYPCEAKKVFDPIWKTNH